MDLGVPLAPFDLALLSVATRPMIYSFGIAQGPRVALSAAIAHVKCKPSYIGASTIDNRTAASCDE